jgi:hypothetical protein
MTRRNQVTNIYIPTKSVLSRSLSGEQQVIMIVTLLADCTLTQLAPGGKASEHAVGQKVWLFKKIVSEELPPAEADRLGR